MQKEGRLSLWHQTVSYRMFIAEAHTVTGEDTHGSGGLQVCGPARSLQTGTGSC